MNAKHTPGPWEFDEAGVGKNGDFVVTEYFVRREGDDVAIANDILDPETLKASEANARLIAAAPDHAMLAAVLASGKARWEPLPGSCDSGEVCFGGIRYHTRLDEFGVPAMTDALRAAIAKAEGGAA